MNVREADELARRAETAANGLDRIATGLDRGPLDLMTQNVMAEATKIHARAMREIAVDLRKAVQNG